MKVALSIILMPMLCLGTVLLPAQSPKWETQKLPMVLDARNANSKLYVLLKPEDLEQSLQRTFYIWVDHSDSKLLVTFSIEGASSYDVIMGKNAKAIAYAITPREPRIVDGRRVLFQYDLLVSSIWDVAESYQAHDWENPLIVSDNVTLYLRDKVTGLKKQRGFRFVFWYCKEG